VNTEGKRAGRLIGVILGESELLFCGAVHHWGWGQQEPTALSAGAWSSRIEATNGADYFRAGSGCQEATEAFTDFS
jgi:hypothetical protein